MNQGVKLGQELGYLRIGAAVPALHVADVDYNVKAIIELSAKARREGVQVLVFPEMSLTGYTLGDLVQHQALLLKAEEGLKEILSDSANDLMVTIVGAPLSVERKIFNSAIVISNGRILGAVPKTFLPNYKEFYDDRWFESGKNAHSSVIGLAGQTAVPFGTDLLFKLKGVSAAVLGIEICEDLWVPFSPHEYQAIAGANVLFNLSASNEVLGKDDWRRTIVSSESGRCLAAYCYVSSSIGESSNDVVFGGHAIVAENGVILDESPRLCVENELIIADVDVERLNFDRRTTTSFGDPTNNVKSFRTIRPSLPRLYRPSCGVTSIRDPSFRLNPHAGRKGAKRFFQCRSAHCPKNCRAPTRKNW